MATKPYNAGEISRQLQIELFQDAGETALAILRNVVTGSPVGDPENWQNPDSAPPGYVGGHFRRNWIVSIGGFNPTELAGGEEPIAATVARGQNTIRQFQRARAARLVIQNNVPYANRLALGWSLQAPAGWVDTEIDLALRFPGGTRDLR